MHVGMLSLRLYLVLSAVLLLVKAVQLGGGLDVGGDAAGEALRVIGRHADKGLVHALLAP